MAAQATRGGTGSRTGTMDGARREKGSAIERTLAIIEATVGDSRPTSATDLAAALDVPKPTVHRICLMLEREGFLQREPDARGFTVGPRLTSLALDILRATAHLAPRHAILKSLSEEIGETCNLSIPDCDAMVYVDRVETHWPLRIALQIGSRCPCMPRRRARSISAACRNRPSNAI